MNPLQPASPGSPGAPDFQMSPRFAALRPAALALVTVTAIVLVALHVYAVFQPLTAMKLRSAHLGLALPLIFLLYPTTTAIGAVPARILDYVLAAAGLASCLYIFHESDNLVLFRMGAANAYDLAAGAIIVLLVLEGARRVIGLGLPVIAMIFLAYLIWGHLLPGFFWHRYFDYEQIITGLTLHTEGVFGIPLGVAATYVFLFMILGAVLQLNGAGTFFINLATAACGTMSGGPAKVAIVASAFFGSINGSAVANVASTGVYTIPMMMRAGYPRERAGAIEAASSSGGQIMPPIMGAAAFIIAEFLGVSYLTVATAALIPGVLYFFALMVMAHLEAKRLGLRGLPREELPSAWRVLREGWLHFIPLVLLLAALGWGYSPQRAALVAIVSGILVSLFYPAHRMTPSRLLLAVREGVLSALTVAGATACAGIVIGVVTITGAGLKLSSLLIALSMGSLLVLLILTMLTSLILGMGLPTTAAYIILAVLVAPTLVQLGVDPLGAHLFIFYFGAFSAITPPVGIAAYAGAAIARAEPNRTALLATMFGFAAYLLPFMMIYSPAYVLNDTVPAIVFAVVRGVLAAIALPAALQGRLLGPTTRTERGALVLAAMLLVYPQWQIDLMGLLLFLIVVFLQSRRYRAESPYARAAETREG
jgi:TRAP transporter 4TM/12TM fusion protein